jgi:GNAT superfamily N-acetyltransferase
MRHESFQEVRMTDVTEVGVRLVASDDLPALRAMEDRTDGFVCDIRFADAVKGGSHYYVAVRGTDLLGTVVLDLKDGPLLPELRNMYVYQHARRQGIGRILDEFAENVARDLGYDEIFLGVDPDNYQAIPLYISLGYEPTGNHRIVGGDSPEGLPGEVFHDAIYRKKLRHF